ncbi:MAG TPA: acetoin utilization protein AcuC, partial [Mariprofundaceae bacterium]|nr:acetoin utilization protein AcuC [Mariprofundaceae bacterium]
FIILQCGADSIAGDPITHLRLLPLTHAKAAGSLCALAEEFCVGRFVALGGGGYNRANLAAAWCAVLSALADT